MQVLVELAHPTCRCWSGGTRWHRRRRPVEHAPCAGAACRPPRRAARRGPQPPQRHCGRGGGGRVGVRARPVCPPPDPLPLALSPCPAEQLSGLILLAAPVANMCAHTGSQAKKVTPTDTPDGLHNGRDIGLARPHGGDDAGAARHSARHRSGGLVGGSPLDIHVQQATRRVPGHLLGKPCSGQFALGSCILRTALGL